MLFSYNINNCLTARTSFELLRVLPDLRFATIPELSIYPDPYFKVERIENPEVIIECKPELNSKFEEGRYEQFGCRESYLYVKEGDKNRVYVEKIILRQKIQLSLKDLTKAQTIVEFNKAYPRIIRFSLGRWLSVGKILNDVFFIKLLNKNLLPLHCGATSNNGHASLFLGHPDVGKTSTVVLLMQRLRHSFISQDVGLVNGTNIVPIEPTSVYKLGKSIKTRFSTLAKIYTRNNLHLIYNPFKNRPINYDSNDLTLESTKIQNLFFLERGKKKISSLDDREAFLKIKKLNNLEFTYQGNNMLLAYDLFNEEFDLDNFTRKANRILEEVVKNAANIYTIRTDNIEDRFNAINNILS